MAQDMPYLYIQEMSAVRSSLSLENFHIFSQGVRKTLSNMSAIQRTAPQI